MLENVQATLIFAKGPGTPLSTIVRQWDQTTPKYSCYGKQTDFDVTIGQCVVSDRNLIMRYSLQTQVIVR